jgi:hypothetical protein
MFNVTKALQDAVQKVLDDSPMAEALIGNQTKLDANKNGKLDKQDFKLLRGGKKEKEKEELDELDTGTLKRYAKKSMSNAMSSAKKGDMETSDKRASGLVKALDRVNKKEPYDSGKPMKSVMKNWHKEEVELDEARFKKGQDVGDPGLNFKKIAAKAAEKYGSKAAGQRVAGFVLKKKLANSRMSEEASLDEGRPSQQHPIEGHAYHEKSDAELRYIIKDAGQAAKTMKNHNPKAESKYLDQVNDASTVLSYRQRNGTPDWYKKKYGHIKESVSIQELKKSTLTSYAGKNVEDQLDRASSASFKSGKAGDMYNKAAIAKKDIKRAKMMGAALRKLADPNYGNK